MTNKIIIEESDLRRFSRLAAPYLRGIASGGQDPHAARDRPGSGLEFLDLRDYQAGDDIRHIDWRQTARRQHAVVRRFRNEAATDWFICVDCSASVGLHASKWAMTIRLASALAYTCLFAGHRVAMLLFSDRIKGRCDLGRGAHQFSVLSRLLLTQNADDMIASPNYRFSAFTKLRKGTTPSNKSNLGLCRDFLSKSGNVFVISDFLQPDGMRSQLQSVCATVSSTSALQVLAEDEVKVPATGIARLQDVESGQDRQVSLSDEAVSKAAEALVRHSARLHKGCAGLGIRFTSCLSDEKWQQVLLSHLKDRP